MILNLNPACSINRLGLVDLFMTQTCLYQSYIDLKGIGLVIQVINCHLERDRKSERVKCTRKMPFCSTFMFDANYLNDFACNKRKTCSTYPSSSHQIGVPKFILISVHDYNLPSFLLASGYFAGKRQAESEVLSKYPSSGTLERLCLSIMQLPLGTILSLLESAISLKLPLVSTGVVFRPGFIYGKRKVDGFEIPLDVIGQPLERLLLAVENFTKPLSSLPASDLLLAPPVSVDDVAYAVINAVMDDDFFGVFTIEQIKDAAAKVRA